jgi:proline iminopeptidase
MSRFEVLTDPVDAGVTVRIAGSGPPLVAVPPAQGGARLLEPAMGPLSDERTVVLADLRGDPTCAIDQHVADLARAFDLAGIRRAVLFGTSFGGQVALAFAAAHPARVDGLVLHATSARLRDHERVRRLFSRVRRPWLRAQLVHAFAAVRCAAELRALGPRNALRCARDLAWTQRVAPAVLARRIDLFCEADLESRLPSVTCPVLVLTGDLDRMVPARSSEGLARGLPCARHVVLARSGHLAVVTEPERIAAEVRAFLRALRLPE